MVEKTWLAAALVFVGCAAEPRKANEAEGLAGPFVHENLAIFVVRGEGTDSRPYLTLDEGLRDGSVSLRETDEGEVGTLVVGNRSDRWLFLHAADIVTGGKQDRTIAADVVVPPGSTSVDIAAFCVEQGRWSGPTPDFSANGGIASGALKLRIQADQDQRGVWDEVAKQSKHAASLAGAPALASLSSTGTYKAVLEHPALRSQEDDFVEALLPRIEAVPDAVGLVAAIGGELAAADVYGSSELFRSLTSKLLASYAREAALASDRTATVPAVSEAAHFLAASAHPAPLEEELSGSMIRRKKESAETVVLEYHDRAAGLLHRSIVKKP